MVSLLLTLRASLRDQAALQIEILAMRHQLHVVNRSWPQRRRLTHPDRMRWVWLSRVWNEWRIAVVIVKLETILAWHRRGFRLFWTSKSRRCLGRPTVPSDIRLLTSSYWDNFINFPGTRLRRHAGQPWSLTLPMDDQRLPGIAAEDIGRCANGVFTAGAEYVGRRIGIAGEHLTGVELAFRLSRALGQDVRYVSISSEEYTRLDVPNAADLANMFQFKREFQDVFCGTRSVELSRRLNPSLQNFDQWLIAHQSQLLA
jgi:NmrA-like family